jgi:16S rRNA (cytosine967-C5)-methyltransferase
MNNIQTGQSSRETALLIMYNVDEKDAYANLELNKVISKSELSVQDRGFITELVYGSIRMQGTLNYVLGLFLKRPINSLPVWIRLILRLGTYQIMFMDHIPDRAAVNESVNLAKKYGHPGTVKLVNGVLRNISRHRENLTYPSLNQDPVAYISTVYSHPRWLVERWMKQFGIEGCISLCKVDNEPPCVTIRTNTLKITRDQLMKRLIEEGVKCRPGYYTPEGVILEEVSSVAFLPSFQEGLFQVQDESSMLVAHVLSPKPGSNVLDACAAPGGKATHAAQMMQNQGLIKAFDIYPHKLNLIRENCIRLGIDMIEVCHGDAQSFPQELNNWADYTLVDAPCSGLGVLRRRPDSRWRKSESTIKELVSLQKSILISAAKTVKPGGILVYSTCTMTPEENELMTEWFIKTCPQFEPGEISSLLSFSLKDGEQAWSNKGMIQFLPHVHGIDGLFIARMKRKERFD